MKAVLYGLGFLTITTVIGLGMEWWFFHRRRWKRGLEIRRRDFGRDEGGAGSPKVNPAFRTKE